ncbi:hypothetical protein VTI28DRAFT_2127 [Corynascus sepedonium]
MLDLTHRQTAGLVAPAAFLFRPARPADSENGSGAARWRRQLEEATCGPDETICPQSGWCCGAGETCSLSNGAFFCCPAGTDTAGCVRSYQRIEHRYLYVSDIFFRRLDIYFKCLENNIHFDFYKCPIYLVHRI